MSDRNLHDELMDLYSRWTFSEKIISKIPTFEQVCDNLKSELRWRARSGCSTYTAHMTTGTPCGTGCFGTTGDPDKDEAIMEQVATWLRSQGLEAKVIRHNELPYLNLWDELEPGYSTIYLEVRWR